MKNIFANFSPTLTEALNGLFNNFSIITILLAVLGLTFIVVQMYKSARGILGLIGAVLILSAFVFQSIIHFSLIAFFIALLVVAFIVLAAHLIKLNMQKKEWLNQSIRIAVNDKDKNTKNYEFFLDTSMASIASISIEEEEV